MILSSTTRYQRTARYPTLVPRALITRRLSTVLALSITLVVGHNNTHAMVPYFATLAATSMLSLKLMTRYAVLKKFLYELISNT